MKKLLITDEEICELYENNNTLKTIANKAGLVNYERIRKILISNNIEIRGRNGNGGNRRNKVNEDYFNEIDTHDKAYFLGVIYSDGCVNHDIWKLTLVSKDIEMVENLKEALGSEHKITTSTTNDKRTGKDYTSHYLQVSSKKIVKSLERFGIVPRKTFTSQMPNIDEEFIPSFLRGLFDGDGHVSIGKYSPRIGVILTEEMCDVFQKYFEGMGIDRTSLQHKVDTLYTMLYYGKKNVSLIRDMMYEHSTPNTRLTRKYDKLMDIY